MNERKFDRAVRELNDSYRGSSAGYEKERCKLRKQFGVRRIRIPVKNRLYLAHIKYEFPIQKREGKYVYANIYAKKGGKEIKNE